MTSPNKPKVPDTLANLRRFEAALRGESQEGLSKPLTDEFGNQALVVLRFIQGAVGVIRQQDPLHADRLLRTAFWIGFGLSTALDLIIFTLWRVL